MTRLGSVQTGAILIALAGAAPAHAESPSQTHEPRLDFAWNRLRDYDEVASALGRLAAANPDLVTISSIGRSSQGREMWLATVTNSRTGAPASKPAIWIDGNIHGNEVQGGDACLYTIWYLTEFHGKIPAVTTLVDERTFYILPMVNPDGRAYWFEHPNTAHSSRTGMAPVDDDRDGHEDEDGPDDLDGDGEITQMRVRHPEGDHIEHPDDPRIMVQAERGKRGTWLLLGSEGIDNDGDGRVNEDGPGGYDMNRNWPMDWQPEYVQYGAGDYPLSYPETRSIAEFLLAHPNVAAFQSYHNNGGMILRGPGAKDLEGIYPGPDVAVYDEIGRKGEAMLPYYRYMVIFRDLYTVHGGEVNWAAEGLGIVALTNELWSGDQLPGKRSEESQDRYGGMARKKGEFELADRLLMGEVFADWKEVDHPTYGRIEVGGFKRMYGRVPPAWMIEEMLHRNMAFTLYHADQMPQIRLQPAAVRALGDGLYEVEATATNEKAIPTRTARAAELRLGRDDFFTIAGVDRWLEVLAGGEVHGKVDRRFVPVEKAPWRLRYTAGLGPRATRTVRWIVRGAGPVVVAYDAQKGGRAEAEVDLVE